jgi:hypothetical protein
LLSRPSTYIKAIYAGLVAAYSAYTAAGGNTHSLTANAWHIVIGAGIAGAVGVYNLTNADPNPTVEQTVTISAKVNK